MAAVPSDLAPRGPAFLLWAKEHVYRQEVGFESQARVWPCGHSGFLQDPGRCPPVPWEAGAQAGCGARQHHAGAEDPRTEGQSGPAVRTPGPRPFKI